MSIHFTNPEFIQGTTPDGTSRLWLARFKIHFSGNTFKMMASTPEMKLDNTGMPISHQHGLVPFKHWILQHSDYTDDLEDIAIALSKLDIYKEYDEYDYILSSAIADSGLTTWLEDELKATCLYPVPH